MFLSKIAGPLRCAVKESTYIVGLEVVPNAREVLIGLYSKTLSELKATIPETAGYHQSVKDFTEHRLNICQAETKVPDIEAKIGHGQAEELIRSAENELELMKKMAVWKPWVVPEGHSIIYMTEEDYTAEYAAKYKGI
ncbi:hypothetical protein CYMTET_9339 [Cymbomonas tetramitiformis]|uniref:NADH dehydrogenase [ubiquinone] 1 alpha subcomplex subunit 5 n=1 Tax=Cymbomonas tetramitiformis TaxID=36881 RepID=A0AAE0LF79_9CHLO|nr:hypothetical protein CYMTET_9339 [Cymbomonas tetramitiformis]|eukprot:gene22750-27467_t